LPEGVLFIYGYIWLKIKRKYVFWDRYTVSVQTALQSCYNAFTMDINTQPSNSQEPGNQTLASNSRKYIYAVIGLIILIIIILLVRNNDSKTTTLEDGTQIIKEQLTNLSAEERQLLESQIAGFNEQLKSLDGDKFVDEKNSLYYKLASAQSKLGKYEDALSTLDKISSDNKIQARIWALRTNIYRDMGDKGKALEAANNALQLDRENPAYWLAAIEFSTANNDEKKKQYEEALKLTQNDIDIVVSYAKFLESIGDKPGAILFWQKAGQTDEKNKAKYDAEVSRLQQP
jgi:tetratricopeptide (TPR) repeat protein